MLEILQMLGFLICIVLMLWVLYGSWDLLTGTYKPAQYVRTIFIERRKTADAALETAKVQQQTEQLRLERTKLEKSG
jgi:hypothetical protein